MSMFEYVIMLVSIVIGLALTHLMQGIAVLIQHPGRMRIWWVHLVWVAHMFVTTLFWWWWEFGLQRIETWTFGIYVFVVAYAFLVYLICAFLFPRDLDGYEGFEDYFLSRRHWFFGLLIARIGIDVVDGLLKGWDYFVSLGLEYPVKQAVQVTLAVVGMISRRKAVQAGIAILIFAYQIGWALRMFNTVSLTSAG